MGIDIREFRQALRRLLRTPLFAGVTVLTLALGIGATTAVFSVIHAVLLNPLPYPEPERLVGVWLKAPGLNFAQLNQGPATHFTFRAENRVFSELGMWDNTQVAITGGDQPEQVAAIQVTFGVFPVLAAQPQLGRLFNQEDDTPTGARTVVLSDAYWRSHFGASPAAIGQTLTVDGEPHEVIGVLRSEFRFLDQQPLVYVPLRIDVSRLNFGQFGFQGLGRLKPGVSLAAANADVERMIPLAVDRFPMPGGLSKAMVADARLGANVHPLVRDVVGDIEELLWVIFGTVGLVLLVACANVANLFLVRAEGRQHELAVRSALGGSAGQIARGLLTESLLLAVAGGVVGVGLAWAGLRLLVSLQPAGLPRLGEIGLDPAVLAFATVVSLLAALFFGSVATTRLGRGGLVSSLKDEGRGASAGRGRQRTRNALVVAQIALALVLLVGSGLLLRSSRELARVDPGFAAPDDVLTFRLAVSDADAPRAMDVVRIYQSIYERLQAVPGVTSVGMSTSITLDGYTSNDPIFVEERPLADNQIPPMRRMKWITPGYFATMQNPLLAGRDISWEDILRQAPVAVVTASLARQYWDDPIDALGKRIRGNPNDQWREIVGVASDVRDDGVEKPATALVYWPMAMADWWGTPLYVNQATAVAVRSARVGSGELLEELRRAVWSVNHNLPLARVRTLREILDRSLARTSFTVVMLTIASLAALILGAVGTYGVTSYAASQRLREIGVRMALGAQRTDVARLILAHGLVLAGVGVALGLAAAAAASRLLGAELYAVSPLDPLTFGAVGTGVALIAVLASYAPARRAAKLDPLATLRG